jgi:hypothetical protein
MMGRRDFLRTPRPAGFAVFCFFPAAFFFAIVFEPAFRVVLADRPLAFFIARSSPHGVSGGNRANDTPGARPEVSKTHSYRSADIGSIRVARRAGK